MWFNWLEVTRTTSKSKDVRLRGDQPHRGLRSVARGRLPSIVVGRDQESQRTFLRRTAWRVCYQLKTVMSLWSTEGELRLRSKSLPWTSTQYLYGGPFGGLIPVGSVKYQRRARLWRCLHIC